MTHSILTESESLNPSGLVELFELDLAPIGFNVQLLFSPSAQMGGSIWFRNKEYLPRAIQVTGFERSSASSPPEPTLTISNVDKGGNALLKQYDDLLGAKFTRLQTYSRFLDKLPNGDANPSSDWTAMYIPEVWYVEQREGSDAKSVRWRLRSILDLNGKKIPNRLVLKDVCTRRYRFYDSATESFVYATKDACPYSGGSYFKRNGDPTNDPALDECTKDFKGCVLRYPNEALPTWSFPGASKLPRS